MGMELLVRLHGEQVTLVIGRDEQHQIAGFNRDAAGLKPTGGRCWVPNLGRF